VSLLFTALDAVIAVEAPPPTLQQLALLLPPAEPGACPGTTVRFDGHTVDGPEGRTRVDDDAAALEIILALVNRAGIEQCESFAAHCGVVAQEGRALAFPAQSGGGKSTLVAACLADGWSYVSDEALVADWTTGALRPYAKPLTLHRWALQRLQLSGPPAGRQERAVRPEELGAKTAAEPLRLAHVVLSRRGAGSTELVGIDRATAATTLLTHSFNHYRRPVDSVLVVSQLARQAHTWHLRFDDPVEAALLLRSRLG
jgi:hypothetical protein